MENKKKAIAACSGMSPYGLVTRAVASDMVSESDNLISLCMGATSADREEFRDLIMKYPIVALNGCEGSCVNKILKQKGVEAAETLNVLEILNEEDLKPTDVSRLDVEGEKSVDAVKKRLKKVVGD